ncbi:hypothetical protein Pr1d_08950 [Bythopirellula goksoeyrii]|uniref:Uncharacterized protein n=1 Tax=Bythopirellula goksoeyrii TaxID=1400387 RepID=A0A5B9QHD1_9BACT|nr:hypothetical protein Pr1d_08950 [Bythopirellula goksoeyrii]
MPGSEKCNFTEIVEAGIAQNLSWDKIGHVVDGEVGASTSDRRDWGTQCGT